MNEIYDLHRPHEPIPGYPHAPADWSEEEAVKLASQENLELQEDHLEIIRALHEYFDRHEPNDINARDLHDALDEKFHIKGGMRYLYTLLPGGPIAQGCRLAGLHPPAGAVDKSFGSVQ